MQVLQNPDQTTHDDFLQTLEDYYAFARPEWIEHQVAIMDWRWSDASRLYRFPDGTEIFLPLLQKRVGAIPLFKVYFSTFYSYGGLLCAGAIERRHLEAILKDIQPLNVSRLTIFPSPESDAAHIGLQKFGFKAHETFTHGLNIGKPFEEIWQQDISSKNRNMIRKAEKNNLHVRISDEKTIEPFVDIYYRMYLDTAQRWDDTRLMRVETFASIFAHLREHAQIYLCYQDEQPLSGVIILFGKRNIFYYASAGFSQYRDLAPNNFLLKEIIRLNCQKYSFFNMGASVGLPNVQKFKESFGAQKIDFYYHVKNRI
ncbi:GNAT family N-acetyltransferase [candidate division KSB1 bacterium]|nr:GNAT family N-acetyltransferase [candidate division KSB1 bacterium]